MTRDEIVELMARAVSATECAGANIVLDAQLATEEVQAIANAILRAIEAAGCQIVQGWLPIESAPKDRPIMLAKFGWYIIDVKVDWDSGDNKKWSLAWACKGHWSERFNNWNDGVEPSGLAGPTHWTELPQDALPEAGPRGCIVPPKGWWCSRNAGHEGPCAARELTQVQP
jgi:hypothetical protein